jgi:uncharacterized protein (DUF58 family)
MRLRLTKIGKVLLAVAGLFYLAALTSQSGLLLLLVGIILGCFAVNLAAAWRSVKELELCVPPSVCLSEGQRLWQPWKLSNRGQRPAGFIRVDSPAGPLFRAARLEARQVASIVPDLTYRRRGVHRHDQVRLASLYPFGLVEAARRLELPGEVVVCPAVYAAAPPRAAGFDVMVGGKHRGQRRAASGVHFAGVRPHQPGDPLKQIHWPSSAKGLGLMVKTYDEELTGRLAVITDTGHTADDQTLDDCLRATGSLILAALAAGHQVDWISLTQLPPQQIPPFADGQEVLEALARIQLAPGCLNAERLAWAWERLPRKGVIHLVLTDFNVAVAELVERLQQAGRSVCVYVPTGRRAELEPGLPVVRYTAQGWSEGGP